MSYIIKKTDKAELSAAWNSDKWAAAETGKIQEIFKENGHIPEVEFKLLHSDKGLYGLFNVRDRYVLSTQQGFNSNVCRDSCVEFFFQPFGKGPYFNFEFNCGGTMLAMYIKDHTRTESGFADFQKLKDSELSKVDIFHTMPKIVEPEIKEHTEWRLGFFIPFEILENYTGTIGNLSGTSWRANLYKCADQTSHPHWISWSPLTALNFHLPECFDTIEFE